MNKNELEQLKTKVRVLVTGTIDQETNTETSVLHAGAGRSFVGLFIETAMAAGKK